MLPFCGTSTLTPGRLSINVGLMRNVRPRRAAFRAAFFVQARAAAQNNCAQHLAYKALGAGGRSVSLNLAFSLSDQVS